MTEPYDQATESPSGSEYGTMGWWRAQAFLFEREVTRIYVHTSMESQAGKIAFEALTRFNDAVNAGLEAKHGRTGAVND